MSGMKPKAAGQSLGGEGSLGRRRRSRRGADEELVDGALHASRHYLQGVRRTTRRGALAPKAAASGGLAFSWLHSARVYGYVREKVHVHAPDKQTVNKHEHRSEHGCSGAGRVNN